MLPVVDDYRGWQAFRVALSPLWPFEEFQDRAGVWLLVLSVASALTNVLFVVLAACCSWSRQARAQAGALGRGGGDAAESALGRSRWRADRRDLEAGYFVWVCSFALLALAAFLAASRRR